MRWWRGKGRRREKVRVGMEADIYPRQCVTGSAKSAMMNVLAGINPQCTPPPPSSSAVPLPPLPPSPLPTPSYPLAPSFPPLNDSFSYTLETHLSLARAISTLPSSSFPLSVSPASLSFLRYSRCIFALLQLQLSSRYCYLLQRFHDKVAGLFSYDTCHLFA